MTSSIPISEIFETIQGEGKFVGYPVLFIRVAGCNLNCAFCDTKYALKPSQGEKMDINDIAQTILQSNKDIVVVSGGEPMLYLDGLCELSQAVYESNRNIFFHIESNGTILSPRMGVFDYISFSPKTLKDAMNCHYLGEHIADMDIKVVTDLDKVGVDMLEFATIVMPLTTYDEEKDKKIKKRVWKYCVEHNVKYSPRLQTVWGKKRGV